MQLGVVGSRLVGLPAKGSFCFSKGYWIPNCVPLSRVPHYPVFPALAGLHHSQYCCLRRPLGGQMVDHPDKQNQTSHTLQGVLFPSAHPAGDLGAGLNVVGGRNMEGSGG